MQSSTLFVLPAMAVIASLLILRIVLSPAVRERFLDRPNERSLHVQPTPRAGGLGLLAGIAATWWAFPGLRTIGVLAFALAAVSILDDLRGLPQGLRFLAHALAAIAAVILGLGDLPLPLQAAVAFSIVWMTNLYNFMDGSNGLAGGMAVAGFGAYAIAAALAGESDLALGCACVAAAALGFLRFNFHPARIFMGDVGSIPLGFLAAAVGLAGWTAGAWPWWFPAVVFSPFVVDATVTLLRRMLRGERFWQAHRSHYYQRLILMGWTHRRTALAEYALMVVVAAVALAVREAPFAVQAGALVVLAIGYLALAAGVDRRWQAFQRGAVAA
jgi:UDP-GlcNAc:undecaprenyl-phosphate GlcNAc-1-phosphate transferase